MLILHLLIALGLFVWVATVGMDFLVLYGDGITFVQAVPLSVYGGIVGVCCLLVFMTVILDQLKAYEMMFLLSRTVLELSLLGVSLCSLGALFFSFRYLKNGWLDFIPMVFIPYLGIFVAMVMFRLFDFNYPYKKRVALHGLLSLVSVTLVCLHLL